MKKNTSKLNLLIKRKLFCIHLVWIEDQVTLAFKLCWLLVLCQKNKHFCIPLIALCQKVLFLS